MNRNIFLYTLYFENYNITLETEVKAAPIKNKLSVEEQQARARAWAKRDFSTN